MFSVTVSITIEKIVSGNSNTRKYVHRSCVQIGNHFKELLKDWKTFFGSIQIPANTCTVVVYIYAGRQFYVCTSYRKQLYTE